MLGGLAPAFVHVLHEIPILLGPDQPDPVRRRLYPVPFDDEDRNEEWRRLVHPDLFALVASARDIVAGDLARLEPEQDDRDPLGSWRVEIPKQHVHAWISALNAARLALGALYGVEDEADLHDEDFEESEERPWTEKRVAAAKIHLLGWLQHLLIEEENPPPPGADPITGAPPEEPPDQEPPGGG